LEGPKRVNDTKPAPQKVQESGKVDSITREIVHGSLMSIAREMGITMVRTSYSVIFSEGYDFSCALLDRWGDMVATANFCPVHLASMAYASRWAIMEIGIDNIHEGDVIIHNDPYRGGTHITDVNVIKPIFYKGKLIAFAANRAHQLDMGGKNPGSFGDSTEIFQEGIRIPPIKWYDRGIEQRDIFDFLLSNVRLPRVQLGDFKAQLASDVVAERRVRNLCEKYNMNTVSSCMDEIMNYSERRMRAEIDDLPEGSYSFMDFMDNDGVMDEPVIFKAKVEVKGDSVIVDFTGSSKQVRGPINAVYGVTASSTFNALLQVSDPSIPVNQGAFRPVRIIAPRGTVVNANYPAPVQGGNTNTSIMLVSLVIGALAPAVKQKAIAASGGTCNDFICSGTNPSSREKFVYYWFPPTGWGALPQRDGWTAISDPVSNCSDTPIEMMEMLYPVRYDRYELAEDMEGAGRYRGGFGVTHQLTALTELTVSATADRHNFSPYALNGGRPARPNRFLVKTLESSWVTFQKRFGLRSASKFSGVTLHRDDSWMMVTTGGGGYGNPFEREPDRVLQDVQDGLVSRRRAKEVYGVALKRIRNRYEVDEAATVRIRKAKSLRLDPSQVLPNGVVVDAKSAKLRQKLARSIIEQAEPEPLGVIIAESKNGIPVNYCSNECTKKADPRLCPWYDEESLLYWNLDALKQWTSRHCPLSQKIITRMST
jgi:N-methylhydantoinase B/oxoprolinase/acetone carboxylase alpha subunit